MNFSRRGLDELTAVVDAGRLDAVLVKDLPPGAAQDADGPVYRLPAGTRGSSDLCHRRAGHRLG